MSRFKVGDRVLYDTSKHTQLFEDMRVDRLNDCEEIRCNKVFNMLNAIRCDIAYEKPIFDSDTVKIAESLAREVARLERSKDARCDKQCANKRCWRALHRSV